MLWGYENVSSSQKFVPYCLLFILNYENYKLKHSKIQHIRNIWKRKAIWDEPIEMVQGWKPNSKQNRIFLSGLDVGLI